MQYKGSISIALSEYTINIFFLVDEEAMLKEETCKCQTETSIDGFWKSLGTKQAHPHHIDISSNVQYGRVKVKHGNYLHHVYSA